MWETHSETDGTLKTVLGSRWDSWYVIDIEKIFTEVNMKSIHPLSVPTVCQGHEEAEANPYFKSEVGYNLSRSLGYNTANTETNKNVHSYLHLWPICLWTVKQMGWAR